MPPSQRPASFAVTLRRPPRAPLPTRPSPPIRPAQQIRPSPPSKEHPAAAAEGMGAAAAEGMGAAAAEETVAVQAMRALDPLSTKELSIVRRDAAILAFAGCRREHQGMA